MANNFEWIEIKTIGKGWNSFETNLGALLDGKFWNLTYTPSGRICVNCTVFEKRVRLRNVFTFFDLVEKVCFKIPIHVHRNEWIICIYFSSETELVVVSQIFEFITQQVFSLNFSDQTFVKQYEIEHEFQDRRMFRFLESSQQHAKFVHCDQIDYVVFVVDKGHMRADNGSSVWVHQIYLVPKNPVNKYTPIKEFLFYLTEDDRLKIKEKINQTNLLFDLDVQSCIIVGTKLLFNLKMYADPRDRSSQNHVFYLVGGYWEVDITKLKDIYARNLRTKRDVAELMKEQKTAGQLIKLGPLRITNRLQLQCYESDVGMVNVFKNDIQNSDGTSTSLLYPTKSTGWSRAITLDYEINSGEGQHRFSLHPHGALLHVYSTETSIYLRVMNGLKVNLMSMALNRALFHKNTPIRNHPVYRLCFNRSKPTEYKDVVTQNILKRKHNDKPKTLKPRHPDC